jgi:magnesium chelatase family protein
VAALAPDEVVGQAGDPTAETSAAIRQRVVLGRAVQTCRAAEAGLPSRLNATLAGRALRRHAGIDADGRRLLLAAVRRFHLSARACDRLLRVSRTIADLAGAASVRTEHLAEALQYRLPW